MLTLFIQQKPIIICKEVNEILQQRIADEQLILLKDPGDQNTASLLETLKDDAVHDYVWQTGDPDALLQRLVKRYQHLQAAGGLITNAAGEILLMFRRGKWDLPKGKMEENETPEETALREITEETGLRNINIEKKLTETWHAYHQFGQDLLKQTHWFKIRFTGTELTVPQIEEDIMDIQWIRPENLSKYLPYAYPNLKAVFSTAGLQV
jgi:8-oxo-dGTP pyrophosphatase MutT (NUDIX family)